MSVDLEEEENRDALSHENVSSRVDAFTFICVILFGLGSWLGVNGVWKELPLLVKFLPEAWFLPSYLSIIVQTGNLASILFVLYNLRWKSLRRDILLINAVLVLSSFCLFLLAVLWQKTTMFAGSMHSLSFFALFFIISLMDCSSNVLFLPFMSAYRSQYLTAYWVGASLSDFLPSLIALIQGSGGEPKCEVLSNHSESQLVPVYSSPIFSTSAYFFSILILMICSNVGFVFINTFSRSKKQRICQEDFKTSKSNSASHEELNTQKRDSSYVVSSIAIIVITFVSSLLQNGMLPSVQSFANLPYGYKTFHLSVSLSGLFSSLSCLLSLYVTTKCLKRIGAIFMIAVAFSSFILYCAALSPYPPFTVGSKSAYALPYFGSILIVFSSIICASLFSYIRVILSQVVHSKNYGLSLLWIGIFTQLGASIGSLLMFLAINSLKIFHFKQPCT